MRTAVDTNVLVCLLNDEPGAAQVAEALFTAQAQGSLLISSLVYAELLVRYSESDLKKFLSSTGILLDLPSEAAWHRAATAWAQYLKALRRREAGYVCPKCGQTSVFICPYCSEPLGGPRLILPNFIVGAHAAVQADALLTRERFGGFFSKYFPELKVIIV